MNIIIGNINDPRVLRLKKQIPNSVVTNTYCKLKNINQSVVIIIPYDLVNQNGFIQNTEISLDELLLKMKVEKIVYGNTNNKKILKDYTNNYHIKTIEFAF